MKPCGTAHHQACDCREAKFQELAEAAQKLIDGVRDAYGSPTTPYLDAVMTRLENGIRAAK